MRIALSILLIALPLISGTAQAFTKEPIEVSGIAAMDVDSSYGYTTISLRADVCNNEQTAKIFLTLKGKNFNGHEMTDVMFDSIILEQGQCRTVTETKIVKNLIRTEIRDWEVKNIKRYRL